MTSTSAIAASQPTNDTAFDTALDERYREPVPNIFEAWTETIAGQLRHRSVRAFLPDKLESGTLELLVAAAQSAPTSSNVQAWSVVAVEDPVRKARLAELAGAQKHIVEAPLFLVWVADLARASDVAGRAGVELAGADFTETFLIATIDAALAAQNALVAAESLGLGTVYIGALRNHPAEVAAELKLPKKSYAVFGLVVGRPDPSRPASVKPRLPQDAVLHRETYDLDGQRDAIDRHDEKTIAFRTGQGLEPSSWTDLIIQRLHTVEALKGRHVLRQVLSRLGLPLR